MLESMKLSVIPIVVSLETSLTNVEMDLGNEE